MSIDRLQTSLLMTPDQYADQWAINSQSYNAEGYYHWMSDQLGSIKTVVEIGCGCGNGTLALVQNGRRVVVIEPNAKAIELTANNLTGAGLSVLVSQERASIDSMEQQGTNVVIVQGDIFDSKLNQLLGGLNFDAIACWLIGAEPERIAEHIGKSLEAFVAPDTAVYRERLHRRCFELGRLCLKIDGCVQMVDRQGIGSWSEKDYAREHFAGLYSRLAGDDYLIEKTDVMLKRMHSAMQTSQIKYFAQDGDPRAVRVFGSAKARLLRR
ncbi:hypothetical protein CFII64_24149 [Pseudomonas sp. CFII64]|uniref:class I SAM-dependent methyltransferase n=1 Tax=Pseudomonas sp. CFII64 TaxID=911242 RepID=UPI0003574CD4|nr:SAM-dependent methyltransferase [Pseudomonas sp. CFII64]EPJ77236.1 hypothetical protein CFII64_24149 [Pseudomonas sp. CFII64]